jgi:hypothetical protein
MALEKNIWAINVPNGIAVLYADVLPVLQVPDNKADAVPCERLREMVKFHNGVLQESLDIVIDKHQALLKTNFNLSDRIN